MDVILPPLAAETITTIAGFPLTNAVINSTLTMLGFVVVSYVIKNAVQGEYMKTGIPGKLVNFVEAIIETLLKYFDGVTKDRKKTVRFLPIVGTLFFFILVSNWLGLLPGVGTIGRYLPHHGEIALIPLFRPANTDLNMTIAMATLAVVSSHIIGLVTLGFVTYANKFVKFKDVFVALKSRSMEKILTAIIEFFVGFLEIISEFAKVASLSLRLFGNIFAGEVLITVLGAIAAFFVPLPFIALELIVGVIQATVFSMLTLVYLTVATDKPHGSHEEEHHARTEDAVTP